MMDWEAMEEVILGRDAVPLPQMITIDYRSATGKLYHTRHRLDRTSTGTLTLEFDKSAVLRLQTSESPGSADIRSE